MSILIDEKKSVLVQGITGREGRTRASLMKDYGTNIVAGVTPGKGGQEIIGVPVYDTVLEASEACGKFDISVLFIPAPLVRSAALESIEAGIKLLVIVPDRVPIYDVLEIAHSAKKHKAQFVGPNTLGVLSPGKGVLGMIGGCIRSFLVLPRTGRDHLTLRRHYLIDGLLPCSGGHRRDNACSRRWRCRRRSAPPRSC